MTAVWMIAVIAVVGLGLALLAAWRRDRRGDLGTVSSQWISEHRLGSNQDYSRR